MKQKLILLATALVAFAPAGFADIVLDVDPLAQTRFLGEQATVAIQSSGGFVGDFDLNISWNPAIVSLFDIDYGTQLGFSIQNAFAFGAGTVNASEISLETPADLMALQPGQTATLLTLIFNTVGLGTSPVDIGVVRIGDENGIAHGVVVTLPGSITVIQQNGVIPEPASIVLLGTVGSLLIWRLRKART